MSEFRWGILGAGSVATSFVLGLRHAESARAVAVASRSRDRAREFARQLRIPRVAPSYADLVADDTLDAIYVATPPALHLEHALLCLNANKPVLVEKPFALDAAQAREIAEVARARGVFCMEAMWTRFLPVVQQARRRISEGVLGEPRAFTGSFGIPETVDPTQHRFDPALGGGALLDRGVYPISLAFHLFGPPDAISSEATLGATGVDEDSAVLLRYRQGPLGTVQASLRTQLPNDFLVTGTEGQLRIEAPIYRPFRMTLTRFQARSGGSSAPSSGRALKESHRVQDAYQRLSPLLKPLLSRGEETVSARYTGNGYHYEADEVMRCVRGQRLESAVMPLAESVGVMEVLDAARSQWAGEGGA